MIFKQIIDDQMMSILKKLIDHKINCIYSDGLSFYDNYIEAQLLVIKISNRFWLNIRQQAKETALNNDYYKLTITKTEFPEGVSYNKIHNSISYPFGKINFKETLIKSIEIYNRHEIYDEDELNYDVLLLFSCKNNFKFMISIEERVDEPLIYSTDLKVISDYLSGLKLRAVL